MKIQINTGPNTDGREQVARQVEDIVENTLGHLAEHVSRVEVHLSDQNSDKGGGADQRCMMEARLEGRQPIAVTEDAASMLMRQCPHLITGLRRAGFTGGWLE